MDRPRLEPSPSVIEVLKQIGPDRPVSAAAFAQAIFRLHGEYAGGAAASIRLEETPTARKAGEWLDEVEALFDLDRIQRRPSEGETPTLHGRLMVIGLSLLEPRLREQLARTGAFEAIEGEIRPPLNEILSEGGRALMLEPSTPPEPGEPSDSVATWPDDPVRRPEDDLLGRAAFARFLARRIGNISPESGAYAIHVYGPWGAGKSTLLNFVRKELEETEKWLVVEFNAWRHQHIQPPWWSLMERVFRDTRKRLSLLELSREYWWRFQTGRVQYLIGLIILAWLLALVVFPLLQSPTGKTDTWSTLATNAKSLSEILALVTTIWGGILVTNRSLLFGAAEAAQRYNDLTRDPTNEIKRRFNDLIAKLLPERVAILIDDLDRCQSRYVVDLLEGIQTLFREAPVVFVVAADRHWLNACYEEVYEKLEPRIHEPGKPLGTLFLEKAFRFSTPMPGIPEGVKERYWRHLLQLTPTPESTDVIAARENARGEVGRAQSEAEVQRLVRTSGSRSFLQQRALREEAAVRLAAPEIQERLEHTLQPYAPLLEPNPRSMKLLVNAYSANRALAILSEVEIDLHQLALWTILSSRWPQLAEYLAGHPDMVEQIGQKEGAGFTDDKLEVLRNERGVIEVVKGDSRHEPLSPVTLQQCAQLR